MVDANDALDRFSGTDVLPASPSRTDYRVAVHTGTKAPMAYADACRTARFAPPQDPIWTQSWAASGDIDLVITILSDARGPLMALALQVDRTGPFRIGRFIGGSHANGNFPALCGMPPDAAVLRYITEAIHRQRPDIDMLALERQSPRLDGAPNPFLQLPHRPSPNVALAASLDGGFDALLERVNGKRKRKKYRAQQRKFESAGGFRRFRASSPEEIDALLGAFFEMKRQRFAAQGIADVFAAENVRKAFHRLYTSALEASPPRFFLEALEVGGRIRAVTGSSLSGSRVVCDFCAFADDELTAASPGDFLFFESIRDACEQGLAIYDFSVGEERYKRAWCDIETSQFDVFLPLTLKGRVLAVGWTGLSQAKRAVKRNRPLWRIVKRLRGVRHRAQPDTGK